MRLTERDPHWVSESVTRHGQAMGFECPCKVCMKSANPLRLSVPFANPLDGGTPVKGFNTSGFLWHREGETFETITVSPSVDASGFGHWHGVITNGELVGGLD